MFTARTVVLIYENGKSYIVHNCSLKKDTMNEALARPGPTLNPKPIVGSCKNSISNSDILDPLFFHVLSQASNADSVTGTASHTFNPEVGCAWTYGYAVITGSDYGGQDGYVV